MIRGRQLSRDTEHRKAMRRNLVQSLFEHGKVRTTLPKAKEVKAMAEKLITLARTNTRQRPPAGDLPAARPPAGRQGTGVHRRDRRSEALQRSRPQRSPTATADTPASSSSATIASATAAAWCCCSS